MIALLVSLVLAASLLALAWVARGHPVPTIKRSIQVLACSLAVLCMVVGLVLVPASGKWQANRAGQIQQAANDLEYQRAVQMISVLGSSEAYIEYLKAIKSE